MNLKRPKFHKEIDADLLVSVIMDSTSGLLASEESGVRYGFVFKGEHERTAKGDEMVVEVNAKPTSRRPALTFSLKRDSLYHILPEYLFHPPDRFAECEADPSLVSQKIKEKEQVEKDALTFFYPFDRELMLRRAAFQGELNRKVVGNNRFIADFIARGQDVDLGNPFIGRAYVWIARLRDGRGERGLLRRVLEAAFGGAVRSLAFDRCEKTLPIDPETCPVTMGAVLGEVWCAPDFHIGAETITLSYQTVIESADMIETTREAIDRFVDFFKAWFLAQDQFLEISFGDYVRKPLLRGNGNDTGLFLGYNTQLI